MFAASHQMSLLLLLKCLVTNYYLQLPQPLKIPHMIFYEPSLFFLYTELIKCELYTKIWFLKYVWLYRPLKGEDYEQKGEDRNIDKLLWDIIAVSTLVITMEDFFSTFLRKKIEKWKYVSIWLFFFFFHMIVMKKMDGYLENILGNLIALSIICWFAYQEIFVIKEMMIFLAISLSAISEGIVAAILIIIKGNINGNTMLYSIISKIIFL